MIWLQTRTKRLHWASSFPNKIALTRQRFRDFPTRNVEDRNEMMMQRTRSLISLGRLFKVLALSSISLQSCTCYSPSATSSASLSRRRFIIETPSAARAGLVAAFFLTATTATPASAATATTTNNSNVSIINERVRLGHARVRYLLDHWDDITSVCGTTVMSDTERKQVIRTENGNSCTKTPLNVQQYMGYKSITDPLYRIDKVLVQESFLANSAVNDDNTFLDYLEAVETYKEMADQTAMLAYTSSWGESNPYVMILIIIVLLFDE
jgi:hypothetical protein